MAAEGFYNSVLTRNPSTGWGRVSAHAASSNAADSALQCLFPGLSTFGCFVLFMVPVAVLPMSIWDVFYTCPC